MTTHEAKNNNRLSHENIFDLRRQAFSKIRVLTDSIHDLAFATEKLDCALQLSLENRNVDDLQDLINAARSLATLLESGVAK